MEKIHEKETTCKQQIFKKQEKKKSKVIILQG